MPINVKKITTNVPYKEVYLDRPLEPLDNITLWGIVKSNNGSELVIEIFNIHASGQKCSGSTSGSPHHDTIVLKLSIG